MQLPRVGSATQGTSAWESLNGEILDLFHEDRALPGLRLGEEMKP